MKRLSEVETGKIITVRKIFGSRSDEKHFENMGIMPGSDLAVAERSENTVTVVLGCKKAELTAEEANKIGVGDYFTRNGDPVLLGGCCGGGNAIDLMEKYFDNK